MAIRIILLSLLLSSCSGGYCYFNRGETVTLNNNQRLEVAYTVQEQLHPSCLVYLRDPVTQKHWNPLTNEVLISIIHPGDIRSQVKPTQVWFPQDKS